MFPNADWSFFPLSNPGIVSIPASFLLGFLGTITSSEHLENKASEMEVRSLTGAGAEGKALDH
jgi:cation/acetate symporter